MYIEPIYLNDCDDVELLAWICTGDSYKQAIQRMNENSEGDEFSWDIDTALEKRFGCDFDGFRKIVERLLPMTPKAKSRLTGQEYHAFLVGEDAIIKTEV